MTEKTVDEEEYQEAADCRIEEFETQYQAEQLLNSDAGVTAEITDVGWRDANADGRDGAVFLLLSVPGAVEYPVIVPRLGDLEAEADFVALCEHLGVEPGRDLRRLVGREVDVDIGTHAGREFVGIDAGDAVVRTQVLEDEAYVRGADPALPAGVARSLRRLSTYRRDDADGTFVRVEELSADGDDIVLHLEDGLGDVRVPRERAYEDRPVTAYERLVEDVGQGSVKQIAGGHVYLIPATAVDGPGGVPFSDVPRGERARHYEEYLMTVDDTVGEWAVFLDRPDPGLNLGPLATITGVGAGAALVLGVTLASLPALVIGFGLLCLSGVVYLLEP